MCCVRCLWFTCGSFPGVLTSFTVTDEDLSFFFGEVLPHLNERGRRMVTGAAARTLGHGGVRAVAGASVAVGTALTGGPPHRSQRAELPHWAPASGSGSEAHFREGMLHAGGW